MKRLIPIDSQSAIPAKYQDTPIGRLLEYHNLDRPYETYSTAELLIGMCMDNRKHLHIPDNFAYIIRAGGANLRFSGFKISYAIGVGGARALALIGHNQCGMVNLASRKEIFVSGMVNKAGWTPQQAEEHFKDFSKVFEIGNEIDFVLSEVQRLRKEYPKILMAPMLYKIEDGRLYLIDEAR